MAVAPLPGPSLERPADGHRVANHPDRLRIEVTPELEEQEHPGILDPDRSPRNRAEDLVPPPEVAPLEARVERRLGPRAPVSLEDRVVQAIEVPDLAIAASVEPSLLGDGPQLHAVLLEHPGGRRGAAPVHAEHRDDGLAPQRPHRI